MPADADATLFHVTATLTEPETLEHRSAEFDSGLIDAIRERRPEQAQSWSADLSSPTRCVLNADIEAMTERSSALILLTALERALFPQLIRPRAINVRVQTIRVEVGYLP